MTLDNISQQLKKYVDEELTNIIKDIAISYNIDFDELKEKYLINNVTEDKTVPEITPKRRGRKKKTKEEFIEAHEYEYNGTMYLIDDKNNVYTHNIESPMMIGERLVDGSIKCYTRS